MKLFSIFLLIFFAMFVSAQQSDTLSSALEEELRLIGEEDLLLSDPVTVDTTPLVSGIESDTTTDTAGTDIALDSVNLSDSSKIAVNDPTSDSSQVTASIPGSDSTAIADTAVIVESSEEDSMIEEVAVIEEAVNVDIGSNVAEYRSPMRAMVFSGIIPGAGQAYAKKYWKTGLFVTLETAGIIGAVKFKNTSEEIEQDALKYITSDPVKYNDLMDSSKKRADWSRMMVVGIIVNHIASGVDAYISTKRYNRELAKEKKSNVISNLSVENQLFYSETGSLTTGVSLAWRF